jgi:hypothetical protein
MEYDLPPSSEVAGLLATLRAKVDQMKKFMADKPPKGDDDPSRPSVIIHNFIHNYVEQQVALMCAMEMLMKAMEKLEERTNPKRHTERDKRIGEMVKSGEKLSRIKAAIKREWPGTSADAVRGVVYRLKKPTPKKGTRVRT